MKLTILIKVIIGIGYLDRTIRTVVRHISLDIERRCIVGRHIGAERLTLFTVRIWKEKSLEVEEF